MAYHAGRMFRRLAPCVALGLLLVASTAAAQRHYSLERPRGEPAGAALQEARSLFLSGSAAVEAGRWADALQSFERSYELSGVSAALYNAATALRSLGRHRDARDAFVQLLSAHSDLDANMRREAEARRTEEAARVAVLSLAGLPSDGRLQVQFDNAALTDTGERPLDIEADAGRHALRVEVPRYRPWQWEGRLTDGQYTTLNVHLELAPVEVETESVFSSPVFWIITGVVVLGAAAATTYFIWDGAQLDPSSNNVVDLR